MYNRIIVVGRVTKDIELRQTNSGTNVCQFTVACDRAYSNGGERKADFLPVVAWKQAAEFASRYFGKGSPIGVEGRLETRRYTDKDNNERTAYEIIADRLFFVGGKSEQQPKKSDAPYSNGNNEDFEEVDLDGDLPF